MQIMQTIKSHPYMTAAIVIGGGLAFFFLSGWFTGGSSSGSQVYVDGGPSDAEIASATSLQLAQISAGVANNQIGAELGATTIAADIAKLQAELAASLGLAQIEAGKTVSLADIGAQTTVANLGAQVANSQVAGSVTVAGYSAALEQARIDSSTKATQAIIDALKPQAPVVYEAPAPVTPQGTTQFDDYVRANPDIWQHAVRVANDLGVNPYDEAFQAGIGQEHYAQYGASEGRVVPVG
jgi:hypothetical protein